MINGGGINEKGEKVVKFKYDFINDFSSGYSIVCIGNKYGIIDKRGNTVADIKYDDWIDFDNGLAIIKSNDKWGLINEQGKELIPVKYDYLRDLSVKEDKNGNVKVKIHVVKGDKEGDIEYKAVRRILGDVYFYSGWKAVKKLK